MEKNKRLQEISKKIGTRHTRKLRKFSEGFNEKFLFFYKCFRYANLNFAGEAVDVIFDINAPCAKECFRLFDDGYYKNREILSRHSNILKAVIIGKKSWGLHLNMWCEAISEGLFTKNELLKIFTDNNIIIPDSFMIDFDNRIYDYRTKYCNKLNFENN